MAAFQLQYLLGLGKTESDKLAGMIFGSVLG